MIFYKIEATIDDIENNLDLNDRKVMRTIANELCEKSESFYHKSKQKQFVFGVGLRNEKITFGMILRTNMNYAEVTNDVLSTLTETDIVIPEKAKPQQTCRIGF